MNYKLFFGCQFHEIGVAHSWVMGGFIPGCGFKPAPRNIDCHDFREYSLTLVNPGGCASKQLKASLLRIVCFFIRPHLQKLGIREYTPRRMNPEGGCFKTIEKLPLRGFSFLFLAIHPSKLGSVLK
jgi:hypothetical protein